MLRQAAWRFCLVGAVLVALLTAFGRPLEDASLPMLGGIVQMLDANHRIERLELLDKPAGRTLQMTVTRVRYVFVGDQLIEPHATATAQATTQIGALQLGLVLVLAGAAAWPMRRLVDWPLRAACTALAVAAGMAVDIPMLLTAEIWRLYVGAYHPGGWSPLVAWSDFMLGGGRYLVPLVLGLSASVPSWRWTR